MDPNVLPPSTNNNENISTNMFNMNLSEIENRTTSSSSSSSSSISSSSSPSLSPTTTCSSTTESSSSSIEEIIKLNTNSIHNNNMHNLQVLTIKPGQSSSPSSSLLPSRSMLPSPSSNIQEISISALPFNKTQKNICLSPPDDHNNDDGSRMTIGDGNEYENEYENEEKMEINKLNDQVKTLQNEINNMQKEWKKQESLYKEQIATLNESNIEMIKQSQHKKEKETFSETASYKKVININEDDEGEIIGNYFVSAFYRNYCPIWLNELWIRRIFIWIIFIWISLNFIIIINEIISPSPTINIGVKIYELSTIYIWLQIMFILTLSVLSIYWNISYFAKNPKENMLLRIILISIGCIVIFCNLCGIIIQYLPTDNIINQFFEENVVNYMNYFIINVLSLLIFCLCIIIIIRRMYINRYKQKHQNHILTELVSTSNLKCYSKNIVTKCVWCILFCDILIFFESMYTFQASSEFFKNKNINYNLELLLRICIDTLLIILSLFIIHRALMYQYIDFSIFNKYDLLTDCISFDIMYTSSKKEKFMKEEINKLLLTEYKLITFYSYFKLILCLAPIADIITDSWTIYIYFTYKNEYIFGYISLLILFVSFRFHTILWLLLKKRNGIFLISNNENHKIFCFIWCSYLIPFISIFINCIITIIVSNIDINFNLLSMKNEFVLFFSPIISPLLIIYQSAKDFIITFFLLKLKIHSVDEQQQIINQILYDGKYINKINTIFGDEYQLNNELSDKEIKLIIYIRSMKHFGCSIPQFILQTFVLIFCQHYTNQFRVTQYLISASSSLLMLIQAIIWMLQNNKLSQLKTLNQNNAEIEM